MLSLPLLSLPLFSLLVAAQLQLPLPTQETSRHLLSGMTSLSASDMASARVALSIAADGKVRECRVVAFVGEREGADHLCREIVGARFTPARDGAGQAVPSVLTTVLGASGDSAIHPGTATRWISGALAPPDVIINLSALPPALAWNPRVEVNVMIDPQGRVAECQAGAAQVAQDWVETACSQVRASGFDRLVLEGQEPVAHIRNLVVKFEAAG